MRAEMERGKSVLIIYWDTPPAFFEEVRVDSRIDSFISVDNDLTFCLTNGAQITFRQSDDKAHSIFLNADKPAFDYIFLWDTETANGGPGKS